MKPSFRQATRRRGNPDVMGAQTRNPRLRRSGSFTTTTGLSGYEQRGPIAGEMRLMSFEMQDGIRVLEYRCVKGETHYVTLKD